MFLSLLFVMLTLQPVQDDVSSWVELIESGHLEQVEAEIRQHPEQTTPIVEELLSRFDSSVHSWRDRPEQRRVRYSDDLLQSGLELTRLVTELTGDNTLERRFEARRDRVRATQLLNDGAFDEAMALIESVRGTARENWRINPFYFPLISPAPTPIWAQDNRRGPSSTANWL